MTNSFLPSIKKLCLEPGLLFPMANVFAFAQSGNTLAIGIAVLNVILSILFTLGKKPPLSPLLLTAWLVLLSGLFSFSSGAWLAGFAGVAFALGNFLNCHEPTMATLRNPLTNPCRKVITHPAIYYGIGYIMVGLMAGGGIQLLTNPFDNFSPLIMVGCGGMTILAASFGLALNLLKSAIPFWILAGGTAINAVAGLWVGNFVGASSCFFSMCGEMRLGWMTHQASKNGGT